MNATLTAVNGDAVVHAFEVAAKQAFHSIMITQGGDKADGHKIVFVNGAFTDMTGFTPEEVMGKTPRFLQGAKTDQAVIGELGKNLENGADFHGKTVNYRKDGSEFMIEWKVFPIRNNQGAVTHHVAVQREITS